MPSARTAKTRARVWYKLVQGQNATLQMKRTDLLVSRFVVTVNWVHCMIEKLGPVHRVGSATGLSIQRIELSEETYVQAI